MDTILRCLNLLSIPQKFGLLTFPIAITILNIYANKAIFNNTPGGIPLKILYNLGSMFLLFSYNTVTMKKATTKYIQKLNIMRANIFSAPPESIDVEKLNDFMQLIPMLWSYSVCFLGLMLQLQSLLVTVICLCIFGTLTYTTDITVYETPKAPKNRIIAFDDPQLVKFQRSLGYITDTTFYERIFSKAEFQYHIRQILSWIIDSVIVLVSRNDLSQLLICSNVSYMVTSLAENIKSLSYSKHVDEIFKYEAELNNAKLQTFNTQCPYDFGNIKLKFASFKEINKLSYIFRAGNVYHIENGSSILKMFHNNLSGGCIHFGKYDKRAYSVEQLHSRVMYISPDLNTHINSIDQLPINKALIEKMQITNNDQKKKLMVYAALTSPARVILFDGVLSELAEDVLNAIYSPSKIIIISGRLINMPKHFKQLTIKESNGRTHF